MLPSSKHSQLFWMTSRTMWECSENLLESLQHFPASRLVCLLHRRDERFFDLSHSCLDGARVLLTFCAPWRIRTIIKAQIRKRLSLMRWNFDKVTTKWRPVSKTWVWARTNGYGSSTDAYLKLSVKHATEACFTTGVEDTYWHAYSSSFKTRGWFIGMLLNMKVVKTQVKRLKK